MTALGSDVRARREAFGFTPRAIADLARIPEQRVLAIEAGTAQPTTSEVSSLAEALACDASMLVRGIVEDPKRSLARFRGATTGAPLSASDLRLLARAAEAGRILASLRQFLREPHSAVAAARSPSAPSSVVEPWRDGYALGAAARMKLRPDGKPISSVQAMFEELGIHVAEVEFESRTIEAASLYELGAAPVILLNRRAARFDYSPARRAVLAHELCHLLHDGGERDLAVVSVETRDSSPIEQRANGFAPSFIVPEPWVELRAKSPKEMALALAEEWGLSFEGAAWHLKNLRRITPDDADALQNTQKPRLALAFETPLIRTPPDQFQIDAEPSQLAKGLLSETAIIAVAEGVISRGRAAEILNLR